MAEPIDPVTETDLCAYVDDELDIRRKMEVADYLSRNPDAAAAVMADLRTRDALRLAGAPTRAARSDVLEAAYQLDRRLSHARIRQMVPRASIAALVLLCGFLAHDEISEMLTPPATAAVPSFVDEAVDTHKAARLRGSMSSELKDTVLNREAIRQATNIVIPAPSHTWRILDNRLVPSDEGPGLEISLDTGGGTPLTFFAVPTSDTAPSTPRTVELDGSAVAYWRAGNIGYVLAGDLDPQEIDRLAEDIASSPVG
jgi:anti-sigma factor RsiW